MGEPIDDYDEVVRVGGLYMEGASKDDVGKLKEAFHEDARNATITTDTKDAMARAAKRGPAGLTSPRTTTAMHRGHTTT